MSRLQRPKSSTTLRQQARAITPTTPSRSTASSRLNAPPTPSSTRTRSPVPKPSSSKVPSQDEGRTSPAKEKISLKEQIALKRAEARKAMSKSGPSAEHSDVLEDELSVPSTSKRKEESVDELGRLGIRETINRARSTGNLNLSSRALVCLPSPLFEMHLGITPDPLKGVDEPEYPALEENPKRSRQQPTWFEAQDLLVVKAGYNEITALQPELCLFGNLKSLDFHGNKLESLPSSLSILSFLTTLDVSNNNLSEIHPAIFSLPALNTFNISHNNVSSIPFSKFGCEIRLPNAVDTAFFSPETSRANVPLPKLHTLNASHNKLSSASIDSSHLPSALINLDLSGNILGQSKDLIAALGKLRKLRDVHFEKTQLDDTSFSSSSSDDFPNLQLLDLGETQVTERGIRNFFSGSSRKEGLTFDITTSEPTPGELRVVVGKLVIKEAWEVEAEERYLKKQKSIVNIRGGNSQNAETPATEKVDKVPPLPVRAKEEWEIKAEQGLTAEIGRRRARMAASSSQSAKAEVPKPPPKETKVAEKEAWEIEAEQGLLTEGGRRRARALAAAAASKQEEDAEKSSQSSSSGSSLSSPNYYTAATRSLTLPSSAPPPKGHARAFSLASTPRLGRASNSDLAVPSPTLPLSTISKQNFSDTLRVLTLSNRRSDPTFVFPSEAHLASVPDGVLPCLEELYLESCSLNDFVQVSFDPEQEGAPTPVHRLNVLELIPKYFPSLNVLELSYNTISSEGITPAALRSLLAPGLSKDVSPKAKGLKVLRLRGNRLTSLEAFEEIASLFKGNRQVPEWRLEELDVRDNDINKIPVTMGLLPLDVFLVDGNTFRVPPRRVWEREGTKGLLNWLRGRIE